MFRRFIIFILVFMLPLGVWGARKKRAKYEIKFATVAPEGSTWMLKMEEMDKEIREATDGEVGFRFFAGGVQGDEVDVIRKMRINQLHGAGFTGNGLGEILPEIRILEVPFMFNNKKEVDHITSTFFDYFDSKFRDKGFVLLGFVEVGYVYLFSNEPIHGGNDLRGMKVWSWEGDPLAKALFAGFDITPVPMALPEVLTGLQTKMIDAVYCAPYAAVGLQWFSRVQYMNKMPLTNSTGAVLISKKRFEKIPAQYQDTVLSICKKHLKGLTNLTRADNQEAIKVMADNGIEMIDPPVGKEKEEFETVGAKVKKELIGTLYDETLLKRVEKELEAFRNGSN